MEYVVLITQPMKSDINSRQQFILFIYTQQSRARLCGRFQADTVGVWWFTNQDVLISIPKAAHSSFLGGSLLSSPKLCNCTDCGTLQTLTLLWGTYRGTLICNSSSSERNISMRAPHPSVSKPTEARIYTQLHLWSWKCMPLKTEPLSGWKGLNKKERFVCHQLIMKRRIETHPPARICLSYIMMTEVHLMSLSLGSPQQCKNMSGCQSEGKCSSVTTAQTDLSLVKSCVLHRPHLLIIRWETMRADHAIWMWRDCYTGRLVTEAFKGLNVCNKLLKNHSVRKFTFKHLGERWDNLLKWFQNEAFDTFFLGGGAVQPISMQEKT